MWEYKVCTVELRILDSTVERSVPKVLILRREVGTESSYSCPKNSSNTAFFLAKPAFLVLNTLQNLIRSKNRRLRRAGVEAQGGEPVTGDLA